MRKAHELRARFLKTTNVRSVFYFDTETRYRVSADFVEHEFWFGYCVYSNKNQAVRKEKILLTQDDFWMFLDENIYLFSEENTHYVIAHNCFFDFLIVGGFAFLKKYGWVVVSPPVTNNGLFILKAVRGSKRLIFLNLGNWFKFSLKELGHVVGLEKYEMPKSDEPFAKWVEYCKRDVEIVECVFNRLLDFINENDLGGLCFTIASQALNSFLYRFLKEKIYTHGDVVAMELERKAYHGGRTECFQLGEINEKIYVLDVNSMYPSVLKSFPYPVRLYKVFEKFSEIKYLYYKQRGKLMICDVVVEVPDNVIGIIPFKSKTGKLIAPVGRFRAALSSAEIDFLLECGGRVVEWGTTAVYDAKSGIFGEYVDFFYSKKEQAKGKDPVFYLLYKLLLNSLYGKFAQRSVKWLKVGETQSDEVSFEVVYDPLTGQKRSLRKYAGIVEITEEPMDSWNSFTAIAVFVTAYAWIKLTKYILEAGPENVYYCDTDSIFTNEVGYNRLKKYVSKELGYLSLEYVADKGVIYAPKDYILYISDRKITKTKGIAKSAVIVLTKNSRIRVASHNVKEFIERCLEKEIVLKEINGCLVVESGALALNKNEFGIISLDDVFDNDVLPEIIEMNNVGYAQLQWLSFAGHVRRRRLDKYLCAITVKTVKREYDKGVITNNGRVIPYKLQYNEDIKNSNLYEKFIENYNRLLALLSEDQKLLEKLLGLYNRINKRVILSYVLKELRKNDS